MKHLLFLFFFIQHQFIWAQPIAITLDDAPFGYSAGMSDEIRVEAMDRILATLKKYEVKATFLVTSGNITEANQIILDRIKIAGHQLGNHTHRHFNFNDVSAATYIADIDSCKLLAGKWFNSNYFRYSMLRRGDTRAKRDSVYAHLKAKGYTIAPVSMDNNEWIYNRDYSRALAKKDQKNMDRIGDEYLDHMKEIATNYQEMGIELMGREVSHILLIHANPINADYLDDLLSWFKKEGWNFITLDEAMEDEVYRIPTDSVYLRGASVLDIIQRERSN